MNPDPTDLEASPLRSYLAERDCPCPNCGYNLRGLAGENCPECNLPLRLSVSLAEPGLGRFLAVLLPLSIVGGMFAIGLLIVIAISAARNSWPSRRESDFLITLPIVVATSLLIPAALLIRRSGRSWLRTLPRPAARRVVAGAFLAATLPPVIWTLMVLRMF